MFDRIYRIIQIELGVNKDSLKSRLRKKDLVSARALFCILSVNILKLSYSLVARELNRDHSTIIYLCISREKSDFVQQILLKYKDEFGVLSKDSLESFLKKRFIGLAPKKKHYRILYEKYEGKCMVCKFDEIVEVHHIVPRYLGGTDDEDNLVLLCPNHHALADRGMINIKGKLELMHM